LSGHFRSVAPVPEAWDREKQSERIIMKLIVMAAVAAVPGTGI